MTDGSLTTPAADVPADSRYGTISYDHRHGEGAYVARRWDKKTRTRRPIGDVKAWNEANAFLLAAGEPTANGPVDAQADDAQADHAGQSESSHAQAGVSNAAGSESDPTGQAQQENSKSSHAQAAGNKADHAQAGHTGTSEAASSHAPAEVVDNKADHAQADNTAKAEAGKSKSSHEQAGVTVEPNGVSDAAGNTRRADLQKLAAEMETPAQWQGLFTALVFSAAYRTQVTVRVANHRIEDLLKQYAPKMRERLGDLKSSKVLMAPCIVGRGYVTLPKNDAELLRCNHYTPLIKSCCPEYFRDHAWCAGMKCGGFGYPCIAPLAKAVAEQGEMPWPVPGDGECLIHSILYCLGEINSRRSRAKLRQSLAKFVNDHLDDEELQSAMEQLGEKGLAATQRPHHYFFVSKQLRIYTHVYMYILFTTRMYIHTCAHMCIHIYTYTYLHTRAGVHAYM